MDEIFKMYKRGEHANQRRISYFGWEDKGIHGFYNYIVGYRKASEVIYLEFMEASKDNRIDIQDTIGFPLCFNYRQCIELNLKYFYLKYGTKEEKEFETFLNNVKHSLIKSWNRVRPILYNLLQYQDLSEENLCIIDKFIEEWHSFDVSSMRMRYPITKYGEAMNPDGVRLDIVNLKEKMDELFFLFDEMDRCIDNQVVDFPLNEEEEKKIKIEYSNCLSNIKQIIKMRSDEKDNEEMQIIYREYNYNLKLNSKIMIGLLYLSASDIFDERCKLAKSLPNRKVDFYKVIVSNMEEVSLHFDDEQSNTEYIYEKVFCSPAEIVIQRLKFAMEIMDAE